MALFLENVKNRLLKEPSGKDGESDIESGNGSDSTSQSDADVDSDDGEGSEE